MAIPFFRRRLAHIFLYLVLHLILAPVQAQAMPPIKSLVSCSSFLSLPTQDILLINAEGKNKTPLPLPSGLSDTHLLVHTAGHWVLLRLSDGSIRHQTPMYDSYETGDAHNERADHLFYSEQVFTKISPRGIVRHFSHEGDDPSYLFYELGIAGVASYFNDAAPLASTQQKILIKTNQGPALVDLGEILRGKFVTAQYLLDHVNPGQQTAAFAALQANSRSDFSQHTHFEFSPDGDRLFITLAENSNIHGEVESPVLTFWDTNPLKLRANLGPSPFEKIYTSYYLGLGLIVMAEDEKAHWIDDTTYQWSDLPELPFYNLLPPPVQFIRSQNRHVAALVSKGERRNKLYFFDADRGAVISELSAGSTKILAIAFFHNHPFGLLLFNDGQIQGLNLQTRSLWGNKRPLFDGPISPGGAAILISPDDQTVAISPGTGQKPLRLLKDLLENGKLRKF